MTTGIFFAIIDDKKCGQWVSRVETLTQPVMPASKKEEAQNDFNIVFEIACGRAGKNNAGCIGSGFSGKA
ncbi:MAG: hypothetical protein LUE20_03905 [Oscillospiraceae bacterium]|nr:hypothetical protein [Oscillospiraceae bacterium]